MNRSGLGGRRNCVNNKALKNIWKPPGPGQALRGLEGGAWAVHPHEKEEELYAYANSKINGAAPEDVTGMVIYRDEQDLQKRVCKTEKMFEEGFKLWILGKDETLNDPRITPWGRRGLQSKRGLGACVNFALQDLNNLVDQQKALLKLWMKGSPDTPHETEIWYRYLIWPIATAAMKRVSEKFNYAVEPGTRRFTREMHATIVDWSEKSMADSGLPLPINPRYNRYMRDASILSNTWAEFMTGKAGDTHLATGLKAYIASNAADPKPNRERGELASKEQIRAGLDVYKAPLSTNVAVQGGIVNAAAQTAVVEEHQGDFTQGKSPGEEARRNAELQDGPSVQRALDFEIAGDDADSEDGDNDGKNGQPFGDDGEPGVARAGEPVNLADMAAPLAEAVQQLEDAEREEAREKAAKDADGALAAAGRVDDKNAASDQLDEGIAEHEQMAERGAEHEREMAQMIREANAAVQVRAAPSVSPLSHPPKEEPVNVADQLNVAGSMERSLFDEENWAELSPSHKNMAQKILSAYVDGGAADVRLAHARKLVELFAEDASFRAKLGMERDADFDLIRAHVAERPLEHGNSKMYNRDTRDPTDEAQKRWTKFMDAVRPKFQRQPDQSLRDRIGGAAEPALGALRKIMPVLQAAGIVVGIGTNVMKRSYAGVSKVTAAIEAIPGGTQLLKTAGGLDVLLDYLHPGWKKKVAAAAMNKENRQAALLALRMARTGLSGV